MTALLLKFAPWLAGIAILLGCGGYVGYHLNPYPERYKDLVATQALNQADAEDAVRKTLSAQLVQAQTQTKVNSDAMQSLAQENAQIAADRDGTVTRVRRLEQLLSAASTRTPTGSQLSKAGGGSGAASAGDPSSPTQIEGLLTDAASECERNTNQLNALIAQIQPQL